MIISEISQHVGAFDGRRISKHNIIIIRCYYYTFLKELILLLNNRILIAEILKISVTFTDTSNNNFNKTFCDF